MKFFQKAVVCLLALSMCGAMACSKGKGNGNDDPSHPSAPASTVQIASAYNTVKILQDEDISSLKAAELRFEAAKGETEGAHLVLRADGVAEYDVTVNDLTNGAGETIPASAMTVYGLKYLNVASGFTTFPAGAYPDPMVPVSLLKKYGENKLEKDKNQSLWFDLKVPKTAAAGEYSGTVQIKAGKSTVSVPVSLTVFDFEMPDMPAANSCYLIWQDWLIDGELDNSIEKYEDYYDFLLAYNLDAYRLPAEVGDVDAFVVSLRKYYDRVACYGIPYERATIKLNDKNVPSINYELLQSYLTAIAQASQEDSVNYFEKAYYYFDNVYDEVGADKYPQLAACIASTNEVTARVAAQYPAYANDVKGVKHVVPVVSGWTNEFAKYKNEVELCPIFNHFTATDDLDLYAGKQDEGYTFTSYGAAAFWPYGSRLIDDYLITARDNFWSKFDYGLKGDLYWNVNAYCNFGTIHPVGYGRITDFYTTASHDGLTAGDGFLLYPGIIYDSETPMPSLRLTALRDGIDDYTYLSMLAKAWEDLADGYGMTKENVRSVIAEINKQVYATGVSKLNFSGLQDVRRTIARLIEAALGDNKLLIADFSFDEKGVSYTVAAQSDTIAVNGATVAATSTATGDGKTFSAQNVAYPDNGVLEIAAGNSCAALYTGKSFTSAIDLNKADNAQKFRVSTQNGSEIAYDAFTHSQHGGTVKATLKGKKFDTAAQTVSYRPWVRFDVRELSMAEELSLWVYNEGDAITVQVGARNATGLETVIDRVTLPANGWRKITVANFTRIARNAADLDKIETLSLSVANLLDGDTERTHTLYIASVNRKDK